MFNLPAEELACEVAVSLKADKLVYIQHDLGEGDVSPSSLSTAECEALLDDGKIADEMQNVLRQAIRAIQSQVKRVHLIDQQIDGGLLLELFTRDGCGTMVTNLFYEGLRSASIDDVGGILSLIEPLEASGTLVPRSREQLELEIAHFQVIEKDGMIIACIACIPDDDAPLGEIACLAVHEDYRNTGLGNQLLEICERKARQAGISRLYTLTTRSSHWFIEHGFAEDGSFELPPSKQTNYNPERGSKVLTRSI